MRLSRANADVETLFDQVDHFRAQGQLDVDLRILAHELGDDIGQAHHADVDGRRDTDDAARLGIHARRRLGGGLQLSERALRLLEVRATRFGERQLTRRSVKQLYTQLLFELCHAAAHRRLR